jgi:sigma-B regulation protein RsbU (phosphoserine phosphatase)
MTDGRFLTLFAAVHDVRSGSLEYVNAGHMPPLVASGTGVRELARGGLPLGLVDDARHEAHRVPLGPSDLLFAFTDGLTEARDDSGEFLGTERVAATLALRPLARPQEQLRAVTDALIAFAGEDAARDDLTLLAYRPRAR